MTVLYVEDDAKVREDLKTALAPRVGELVVAEEAEEGLSRYRERAPDIVVTDLGMPGMDGIALARAIRAEDPEIPVVLTASEGDAHRLFEAIDARIDAFVKKPLDVDELLHALDETAKKIAYERSRRDAEAKMAQHYLAIEEEAMLVYIDKTGRIRRVNAPMAASLDFDPQTLQGRLFETLLHPAKREERYRTLFEALRRGESWHGELHLVSGFGMELIYKGSLIPLYDTLRPDYQFMLLLEEITELVNYRRLLKNELDETQNTLQEKIHFLEQYQNAINEGTAICRFLEDGTIVKTDERFDTIFGFRRRELVRRSFYQLCPNVRNDLERMIKESARRGEILRRRIECMDKTESRHVTDSVFIPIYRLDGSVEEIISIHNDITDVIRLGEEIRTTQKELLYILGEVAESRSKETGHHVKRVAEYSRLLGELAGLDEDGVELLAIAAPMHDVGKIAIPDAILLKPGPLTEEEFDVMKRHTLLGGELFAHSDRPFMEAARIVALEHHENYDGSGYPCGKRGEEIHIFGRIVALADVFDALSMDRVYKKRWPLRKIVGFLKKERGRKFDPRLTDLFLEHIDLFLEIREKFDG